MNQKLQRILFSVATLAVTGAVSIGAIAAKQELPKFQNQNYSQNSKAYRYLANLADRSRNNINIPTQTKNNNAKTQTNLGFLVSYETEKSGHHFDLMMQDVAFTYDNAVAALAFIAAGDRQRAQQIVDTILYAQQHDRFFRDGRVRNAYRGGKPLANAAKVLLPGRSDPQARRWVEQESQISTHTGNIAWAMLALLGYYQTYGGKSYLNATLQMGEWIEKCHSTIGAGGYTGGFSGWERQEQPITYKSTEHNIDLYAAFQRLYMITGDRKWERRANRAKQFVFAMWDRQEGKFWTGTQVDGVTAYREVIPVDIQAWALLAFGKAAKPYQTALKYAEQHHQVRGGFDFDRDRDGIWYEGTAQMALAYQVTGQIQKTQNAIATLRGGQDVAGGLFTSDRPELTTGFILPEGHPWLYYRRLHVGATAWMILAEKGVNPFWLGNK